MADASLPDMRARSRPGTAIAAMIPMIATTISNSISVKPFWLRTFIESLLKEDVDGRLNNSVRPDWPQSPAADGHP